MLTRDDIVAKVDMLKQEQAWNHNFLLPFGIETRPGQQKSHGKNQIKLERLQAVFATIGLKGKTVLDVGCNEGFFSLYMAEQGAQVLGIDIDEHRISKACFVQEVIGQRGDVRFRKMDIYSQEFRSLPDFDLCLCLGFVHRVPDPYTALAALAERSNMIVFEWKALKFGPHDEAFAYFSPKAINEADYFGTEYWLLTFAAMERILRRLGFCHFHRIDNPRQRRAILIAGKHEHVIFQQPDWVKSRGRFPILLSHCKRFLRTLWGIASGRINA